MRRSVLPHHVLYIDAGRVTLGLLAEDEGTVAHQLGYVQGPAWLDASAAVLNAPCAVDAVAQTEVLVRSIPKAQFRAAFAACEVGIQLLITDLATAHRQQTVLGASRLAKDAEARCAEWLLGQAQPNATGICSVQLQQRKRSIAAQLGIAPETLSRALRHLRERSLISGSGRVVNLVDLRGLRSLAGV